MIELAADLSPEELQVFLQDTDEQLQLLDDDIIKLENEDGNTDLLQEIFRAAHTIKGSSAMVGFETMAELTHAMESILDKLRHGELSVTTEITDALLLALDDLRVLRENITADCETAVDISAAKIMLEDLINQETGGSSTQETFQQAEKKSADTCMVVLDEAGRKRLQESLVMGHRVYQIEATLTEGSEWGAVRFFQVMNELESKGVIAGSKPSKEEIETEQIGSSLLVVFAGLEGEDELGELLGQIPDIGIGILPYDPTKVSGDDDEPETTVSNEAAQAVEPVTQSPAMPSNESGKKSPQEGMKVSETVRIDVDRLDSLMNQVGELVVARTAFNRLGDLLLARYKDDDEIMNLSKALTNVTKIVDDLQLDITAARMMPVGTVFSRFPRLMRDLAQKAGKKIEFIMEGQETGIDRSVIEHIRDPLVHLLRNAADHGVETPERRQAAGKPERATVRLTAAHEQNYIAITVEDDGKGINGANLKEKAVNTGVISSEAASRMSDAEAVGLIFEAGLSTAEKITDVSGRGVGMDVVKTNIETLNGNISVETVVGKGSKFTLRLPLTLATINGLLVSTGGITFAVPLLTVSETLRLDPNTIQTVTQKPMIMIRDRVVPLVYLNEAFDIATNSDNAGKMVHIAVVKTGDRMVGLVVDALLDPQEVVIKSLGKFIGDVKGIAGASILGTGEVALILDVPSLIKSVIMRN